MTFFIACWAVGTVTAIAGWLALNEWVRLRHPGAWTARTGLNARTRLPVDRADQLVETRRRAGTDPWRSR